MFYEIYELFLSVFGSVEGISSDVLVELSPIVSDFCIFLAIAVVFAFVFIIVKLISFMFKWITSLGVRN